MYKSIAKMAGCAFCVFIGLAMIEQAIVDSDGTGSMLFMIATGLLFIVFGVAFFRIFKRQFQELRGTDDLAAVKKMMRPGFEEKPDDTELEKTLSGFRSRFEEFFARPIERENHPIQADVTQVYRNMLEFRRRRLRRLGVTSQMTSKRMIYKDRKGVKEATYSDGKYQISDVTEEIAAKTVYKKDGEEIFTKLDKDIATYTLIHAVQVGGDQIICPNCGAESTREDLLDGCDYCGTKFNVEDLGTKIAEFALRTDYDIEYAKFAKRRNKVLLWTMAVMAAVVFLWSAFWTIKSLPEISAAGGGIIMTLVSMVMTVVTACVFLFPMAWFVSGSIIIPLTLTTSACNFASKKVLAQMKTARENDRYMADQVRRVDPLFSIENFYSGVMNKVSALVYADDVSHLKAFADCDLGKFQNGFFSNVIDIDTEYLSLKSYRVQGDSQIAEVLANLRLTEYCNGKCKFRRQKLLLELKKAADCKTQVVCAPSILRCRGCGASLDLLNGRYCSYCGGEIHLEKYDWVITAVNA